MVLLGRLGLWLELGVSVRYRVRVSFRVRVSIYIRLFALYFIHRYSVDGATGGYCVRTMNITMQKYCKGSV